MGSHSSPSPSTVGGVALYPTVTGPSALYSAQAHRSQLPTEGSHSQMTVARQSAFPGQWAPDAADFPSQQDAEQLQFPSHSDRYSGLPSGQTSLLYQSPAALPHPQVRLATDGSLGQDSTPDPLYTESRGSAIPGPSSHQSAKSAQFVGSIEYGFLPPHLRFYLTPPFSLIDVCMTPMSTNTGMGKQVVAGSVTFLLG